MKKLMKLSIPLLLGVLLMTVLVGVAAARPNARPVEQAWRVLAVPAHACVPDSPAEDYVYTESSVRCITADCYLSCPIYFPAAGEQAVGAVNVKRVTMFAFDNTGGTGDTVRFCLSNTYPPTDGEVEMAMGSTTDSADSPQTVMDTSIDYNPIYRTQAPVIWILMEHDTFWVSGFHVHYTW
jgi:hypothetical protein